MEMLAIMVILFMFMSFVSTFLAVHYKEKLTTYESEYKALERDHYSLSGNVEVLTESRRNLQDKYTNLLEQNDIHQTEVVALLAQLAKLRSDLFIKSRLDVDGFPPDENAFYLYMCVPVDDVGNYYGWKLKMAYWDVFNVPVAINYTVEECELPEFFQTCLFKKIN